MAATSNANLNANNNPFLQRCYAFTSGKDNNTEMKSVYDEWATSYDKDMITEGYVGPALAAASVAQNLSAGTSIATGQFLDAGCGTGLAAVRLAELGAKIIDGVDLSEGMLKVARQTGVYRDLQPADLSKQMAFADDKYDAVICVGTLTQGHVGPEGIAELLRVVKPGGVVVATVLDNIWESRGYKAETERLVSVGKAQLVSADVGGYRSGSGVNARMLVLRAQ